MESNAQPVDLFDVARRSPAPASSQEDRDAYQAMKARVRASLARIAADLDADFGAPDPGAWHAIQLRSLADPLEQAALISARWRREQGRR